MYKCIEPTGKYLVGDVISKETFEGLSLYAKCCFTPISNLEALTRMSQDLGLYENWSSSDGTTSDGFD